MADTPQPSASHLPEEDRGQEGGEGHQEERLRGRLLLHLAPKERPLLGKSSCCPPCLPPAGPSLVLTSGFCSSLCSFIDLLACSLHRGSLGPGLRPTPGAGADSVRTRSLGQWVNERIRSYQPSGISQNLLVHWASLLTPCQPRGPCSAQGDTGLVSGWAVCWLWLRGQQTTCCLLQGTCGPKQSHNYVGRKSL